MRTRTLLLGLAVMAALALLDGRAGAGGDKKKPLSFEEIIAKYGTPSEEHKALEPLAGTWHAEVKFYMAPGKPPEVSEGTMTRTWILGKRFLKEEYEGKAIGESFRGLGLTGYDRKKQKYTAMWIDSMSTSIGTQLGTYDASTKTFTFTQQMFDPFVGAEVKTRDVLRIVSDDRVVQEMFKQMPGGKTEVKTLEITYTRKK